MAVLMALVISCIMLSGALIVPSSGADEATVKAIKEKLVLANRILEMQKMATPFGHVNR